MCHDDITCPKGNPKHVIFVSFEQSRKKLTMWFHLLLEIDPSFVTLGSTHTIKATIERPGPINFVLWRYSVFLIKFKIVVATMLPQVHTSSHSTLFLSYSAEESNKSQV
jgi:hypothetical protein